MLLAAAIAVLFAVACWMRVDETPLVRGFARAVDRVGASPVAAPLLAFALTVTAGALMAWHYGAPHARSHDEFSYLLGADTFASGRLRNDPHPLWRSFETFHVLQQPSYASKYPPGQALFLAAGQVLTGSPFAGVLASTGLAAAAIAWMVRGVASARAAMVAALVASGLIGLSYWSFSFWGGAVAALAGALVTGGALRWLGSHRVVDACAAAAGTTLLTISRPFEGSLLVCAVGGYVAWQIVAPPRMHRSVDREAHRRAFFPRLALPYAALVSAGLAALLFYNHRVTGSATTLPYMVYEKAYDTAPVFVWGKMRSTPQLPSTQVFADFVAWNKSQYLFATETAGAALLARFLFLTGFFVVFPLVATLPLALFGTDRRTETRFVAGALVFCLSGMMCAIWAFPHYAAPVAAMFVLLHVRGLAVLWDTRARGRRVGAFAAAAVVTIFALQALDETVSRGNRVVKLWHHDRARMEASLSNGTERHLVVVRYGPKHDFLQEWVYNRADIDAAPVVWARELDAEANLRALEYFHDRKAWLLTVTDDGHELTPLDVAAYR